MANQTDLRVKISADLADIKQGLGLLRGELAKVKQQSAQVFGGSEKFTSQLASMRGALTGLFTGLSAGALFAGIIQNTKEAEEALAQLRAGLKSTGGIAGVTEGEIVKLAEALQKTTTFGDDAIVSMASVVATFTNIRGAIFKEAIPAILDLSTRLKVDLNSAALQVGKALNDPISGIAALGRAGVQFTASQKEQIKSLVETGKVQDAQRIILDELATQMGGSAVAAADTFSGSLTQLKNAFGDLLEGDSSAGGIKGAKSAVQQLTAALQDASTKQAFAQLLELAGRAAQALAQGMASAVPVVRFLIENLDALAVFIGTRLAAASIPALIAGVLSLKNAFVALRTATLAWSAVSAAMGGPIALALAAIATALYVVYQRTDEVTKAEKLHSQALEENSTQAQQNAVLAYQLAAAKRQQAADTLKAARALLEERRARFQIENQSVTARGGDRGDAAALASTNAYNRQQQMVAQREKEFNDWSARVAELERSLKEASVPPVIPVTPVVTTPPVSTANDAARKVIKGMVDQSALALDQIKRDLDALEQRYQDGGIKLADYFAQKQALQLQEIDIKIAEAQADAEGATSTEQQSRALTEIIKLQRDRAAIGPAVAREQAKAEREAAQATADNLRQRSSAVMSQMQADMSLIDAQVASFSIAPGEAEKQLQAIRDRSIEQLKVLRGQMQAYLATLSPESSEYAAARLGLTQLDTDLAQLTAQQQQYKMAVADQATSSLTNFFTDLATGAKSFKDAFKDMVLSFVQGLARMAAEMLAKRIILSLFSSFGGGGGGGGGGGMPTIGPYSALGNVFAPGGMRAFAKGGVFAATLAGLTAFAAGGAFTNSIVSDPTLFAFGRGGQFGVMGEAGPEAIMPLERGPDGRLGVTANGGGGGLVTTPIVAIGDEAVANALASAAGERVVLTHVRNNWTGLTRG